MGESTRLLLMEELMEKGTAGKVEISPILAWSDIKYIAPVTYPDTVLVTFDIVKLRKTAYTDKHIYTATN